MNEEDLDLGAEGIEPIDPTCEVCKVDAKQDPHLCPLRLEIKGDTESKCSCCPNCTRECSRDV